MDETQIKEKSIERLMLARSLLLDSFHAYCSKINSEKLDKPLDMLDVLFGFEEFVIPSFAHKLQSAYSKDKKLEVLADDDEPKTECETET